MEISYHFYIALKLLYTEMWLALYVKLSVVWEYIKSCTFILGFLTLLFNVGYNGFSVGANIWLAEWSTDEDNGVGNMKRST